MLRYVWITCGHESLSILCRWRS